MDVQSIQERLRSFTAERDWDHYHSPKNLTMALAIEASELMEIFQWVGAEESRNVINHPDKMAEVEAELSDVCGYALQLADVLGIDLESAIWKKIEANAAKYPLGVSFHWTME